MMKQSSLQFQISNLQHARLNTTVETLAVTVVSLFVSAILPSLLVRYVYANQQLFEQPKTLEYIPVVAFAVVVGYAIYALVTGFNRSRKIAELQKELAEVELLGDGCCGDDCGCGHDDWSDLETLEELDRIVDEAIAESTASEKKPAAKKATSSKKTTKSKKAASKKS